MKPTAVVLALFSVLGLLRCSSHGQEAAGPRANLLTNGSFQDGLKGWTIHLGDRQATIQIDPTVTRNGHPTVRIDQPNVSDTSVFQKVTLKTRSRYLLSGWMRVKNVVKVKPEPAEHGESGALIYEGDNRSTLDGTDADWIRVSQYLSHPSGKFGATELEAEIGARLGLPGWNTGTVWLSDISLVEVPPATPKAR
jgi:hypothetical protein